MHTFECETHYWHSMDSQCPFCRAERAEAKVKELEGENERLRRQLGIADEWVDLRGEE